MTIQVLPNTVWHKPENGAVVLGLCGRTSIAPMAPLAQASATFCSKRSTFCELNIESFCTCSAALVHCSSLNLAASKKIINLSNCCSMVGKLGSLLTFAKKQSEARSCLRNSAIFTGAFFELRTRRLAQQCSHQHISTIIYIPLYTCTYIHCGQNRSKPLR